jgi:hypothetical protein
MISQVNEMQVGAFGFGEFIQRVCDPFHIIQMLEHGRTDDQVGFFNIALFCQRTNISMVANQSCRIKLNCIIRLNEILRILSQYLFADRLLGETFSFTKNDLVSAGIQ